jgi:hypothetical protein
MNDEQREDILKTHPTAMFYEDSVQVEMPDDCQIIVYFEDSFTESYAWNLKGDSFEEKLKRAFEYVRTVSHNPADKYLLFLNCFKDCFHRIPGFDGKTLSDVELNLSLFPDYLGSADLFWESCRQKFSVRSNRKLCVLTWGSALMPVPPSECQACYNSAVIRGSATKIERTGEADAQYKLLIKLRGTSGKVQYEVRGSNLFEKFIENIVSEIEQKDLTTIGIFCVRGHHRSVSCAEMLIHLYPQLTTRHLTLFA